MLCSLFLSISIYGQKINGLERIDIDGFYTNPLFSPTGEFVLLSGEHLKGVYLLELKNNSVKKISDLSGSGYAYSWDLSGDSFYFKEKPEHEYYSNSKVVNYNVRNNSYTKIVEVDHNYLPSYTGKTNNDQQIVVYTNIATLKIEAKDLVSSKQWMVTEDEGQFYNAILSHDGKKVAVHNGADIYVYSIDNSFKAKKVGTGIATAWTEDDKALIGFLDESRDGHVVTNSELYLFNVETAQTKKITNTEVLAEMYPTVYKDKIIFADDKSGGIFTATLKLK